MIRLFRTSIVFRSTLVVLSIALIIGAVSAAVSYFSALDHAQVRSRERMLDLLSTVENTTSIACYVTDLNLASEVSRGLTKNKDVRSVKIISGNQVLAFAEKKIVTGSESIKLPGAEVITIERDVFSPFNSKEKVCRIVVEPDQQYIRSEVVSVARRIGLLLLQQAVLIALAVIFVVLNMITRPIKTISDRLHTLSASDGARLELPRGNENDEIGQLVGDVNALVSRLVATLDEERQLRMQHQIGEKKFKTIFDNAETGIFLIDSSCAVISCNQAFLRILQLAPEISEADARSSLLDLLSGQESRLHLMVDQAVNNEQVMVEDFSIGVAPHHDTRWLNIVLSALEDGVLQGLVNDITSRKADEEVTKKMAVTDHLTGVANRLGFDLELQKIEREMQKNPALGVFLFLIDLDRFKEVNDEYGHDAGDKVLRYFTKLLRKNLRKTDFIGRLGGDEFVVLIRNLDMPEKAEIIAQTVIDNLALPITIAPDEKVEIGASIGISYYKGALLDKTELIRQADIAMYEVKRHGRNAYRLFSDDLS